MCTKELVVEVYVVVEVTDAAGIGHFKQAIGTCTCKITSISPTSEDMLGISPHLSDLSP